jgi:hypothetical protein
MTPDSTTTISSSIAENIKPPTTAWTSACDEGPFNYQQPPTTCEPACKEGLSNYHRPPTTFRSPAGNEGLTNYHQPPATLGPAYNTNYHYSREKNDGGLKGFFIKEGKGRSAIPTVKFYEHPSFTWLSMKESMSLDEAFRAIHDTQDTHVKPGPPLRDLPAGVDQIILSFKEEYADRSAAGFWAFWEEDRFRPGSTRQMLAIHLRDIWRLTRYCGHKIRLSDEDADAVVRLGTLHEDPHQLGVTIFYQEDGAEMYKHRYVDHHYGQEHDIQIYCDLNSCKCKDQGHAL